MGIKTACAKAIDFLLESQNKKGWWIDFVTLAGKSDEWVTAYVGYSLAGVNDRNAQIAVQKAWKSLKKRRFLSSGWGYNARVPVDSDSTIWALLLGESVGDTKSIRLRRAYGFIDRVHKPSGGIPTYPVDKFIRIFTGVKKNISFDGWCSEHICVTSAACQLRGIINKSQIIDYLIKNQKQDGSWSGYWWKDPEYSTCFALKAFIDFPEKKDIIPVEKGINWILNRIRYNGFVKTDYHPTGSPFATALCLKILLELNEEYTEEIKKIADWLTGSQLNDGSWISSARLRIPPPNVQNPDDYTNWNYHSLGGGGIRVDQNRLFTTATVLESLYYFYQKFNGSIDG